jgi:predicted ATPase
LGGEGEITRYEAVQLFIARARAAKAGFAVTDTNATAVAEICHRLDGLPLAIELAAARVKLFDPAALLARLAHPLQLLINGPRDLPARQQTMRSTIDWSYNLLDADEQRLFRRLGVFVGGCKLETAEAVCQLRIENEELRKASHEQSILNSLETLAGHSLLRCEAGSDGGPRFVMLEMIHEYALEQLEASGEAEILRRRHASYYLALAEAAEQQLYGVEQKVWLERLEAEIDNLRAALAWSLAGGDAAVGVRIAGALEDFWLGRGHMSEGRRWLEDALAQTTMLKDTPGRAKALLVAGFLTYFQGDQAAARARYEESLAISTALGDQRGRALALVYFGWVEDNPATVQARYEEALALFRDLDDRWGIAWALAEMAFAASNCGEYRQATAQAEEALALFRDLGDRHKLAYTLWVLGMAVLHRGDYAQANMFVEESLAISRELGDVVWGAYFLLGLGAAALYQGDYVRATVRYEEALAIYQEVGDNNGRDAALQSLGRVAYLQGNNAQAVALLEESIAWNQASGKSSLARVLQQLAAAVFAQGDVARARALLDEALVLHQQHANKYPIIECLEICAELLVGDGRSAQAAHLLGALAALRESIGAPLPPGLRAGYDRTIVAIHAQLDEAAFAAASNKGRALSLEQVIAEAQSLIRKPAALIRKPVIPDEPTDLITDTAWGQIVPLLPPRLEQKLVARAWTIARP